MNAFTRTIQLPKRGTYSGYIEVTFSSAGRLSLVGEIKEDRRDYTGGQCQETIQEIWPETANLVTLWSTWHLNDMQAGSPCQTAWLRRNGHATYSEGGYSADVKRLTDAGLNPDPETGYRYGSAWLAVLVPDDVVDYLRTVTFA